LFVAVLLDAAAVEKMSLLLMAKEWVVLGSAVELSNTGSFCSENENPPRPTTCQRRPAASYQFLSSNTDRY